VHRQAGMAGGGQAEQGVVDAAQAAGCNQHQRVAAFGGKVEQGLLAV